MNQVREQADSGIATSVQTINSLLTQFQTANAQIVNGTATGADITNAQDTRSNILTQLAQQIGIATTTSANGSMSIYTDSGATLFQGGVARSVTFSHTSTYTPSTTGNAVYVDGVPITGASASMPISSGNIAGLANLRDNLTVTYQAQLDGMAGALINTFAESVQTGSGPNLPGLITTPGATSLPTSTTGLTGQISVNASVDPTQGGNALLLRDGGISGNSNYTYNTSGKRKLHSPSFAVAWQFVGDPNVQPRWRHLHQCKPEQLRVRLRKLARSPAFECFVPKYISKHVAQYSNDSLVQCDRCQYQQ